ncbi:MAG: hypothetical protein PHT07_16205 [Paludibacter sp.]|nr:hypothetical protein [Paludibacter sp.]
MKKTVLFITILCICFNLSCYSRGGFGGFHSSGHSFHSSRTSSHSMNGRSTTHTVGSSAHTNSVRSTHGIETGFNHSPRPVTFYRNNPSYRMVNNHYYPVYHRSPNYLLWYFVIMNHRTHRNDTIKAKSKEELDKKVKSVSTEW